MSILAINYTLVGYSARLDLDSSNITPNLALAADVPHTLQFDTHMPTFSRLRLTTYGIGQSSAPYFGHISIVGHIVNKKAHP